MSAHEIKAGEILFSNSFGYSVLEFIGEGGFGKVAKCQNLVTKETVAVKILKRNTNFFQTIEHEVTVLKMISFLNPDRFNVVRFFEQFEHIGQTCLVLEMLDCSLYELLEERDWEPLPLHEIRPIAKQLFAALDVLKSLSILHTDIKPDNVMFVNRAPEVSLGLPFNEAIDVWGVGCILAFLYLAQNLFPVDCTYQMIKGMVKVLGQPEDHLLRLGIYTQYFFIKEEAGDSITWRLMTPEEHCAATNIKPEDSYSFIVLISSLDDLINIYPEGEAANSEDRRVFVDMVKGLLHLDGAQRTSPHEALQHSFVTVSHLKERHSSKDYLATSQTLMNICQMDNNKDFSSTASATLSFDGHLEVVTEEDALDTWSSDDYVSYDDVSFIVSSYGLSVPTSDDRDAMDNPDFRVSTGNVPAHSRTCDEPLSLSCDQVPGVQWIVTVVVSSKLGRLESLSPAVLLPRRQRPLPAGRSVFRMRPSLPRLTSSPVLPV
ncbi:homeodomain-interacting protein kinase 2-like [Solea senegalensis]|uniref:Homeodomain-interacting protein kinase 2-like n=1 Tax=Solea senegalensis TaxID=28829 RepID=A0AAV6SBU5_SOLSE|nr:homeodomain-interacting protein kinase 2-like [Solea senegalensis]